MARHANSGYKDSYCELIINMFKEGKALEHFCIEVGHPRKTVFKWIDKYPNTFGKAYKMAREHALAYRNEFIHKNSWVTNDPEGGNYDVRTYEKTTAYRFKDMQSEAPKLKLLTKNGDLLKTMSKLINLTANDEIDNRQAKNISDMLLGLIKIKDQEVIIKKLEELEKIASAQSNYTASKIAEKPIYDAVAESSDDLQTE